MRGAAAAKTLLITPEPVADMRSSAWALNTVTAEHVYHSHVFCFLQLHQIIKDTESLPCSLLRARRRRPSHKASATDLR